MKLDNLAKRLRRDITSSPKKAAVLGLLLLVAVWYWTPLIWGWLKPDANGTARKAKTDATAPPPVKPVALDPAADESGRVSKSTWKEITDWIQSDPRMITASDAPGRTHPFDPVEPPTLPDKENQHQRKGKDALGGFGQSIPDPASLGLALSSTIVGPHTRAVLINGKTYQRGDTIRLNHNGQSIDFQLIEIRGDSVVLQRAKKQYEIRLPEPTTSGRLEMTVLRDE